ncbi:MAG: hypothetical protein ACOCV8_03000 [Spirochaetota bacterium]
MGCSKTNSARFTIIEFEKNEYKVKHQAIEYDKTQVIETLNKRRVPARAFIKKFFFNKKYLHIIDLH